MGAEGCRNLVFITPLFASFSHAISDVLTTEKVDFALKLPVD